MKKGIVGLIIFTTFLILGLFTLKDYGISWDEPVHFRRGQAYLWYFLTGDKDYHRLPAYDLVRAQTDASYHERSLYQLEDIFRVGKHPIDYDMGHPPLSDISSSLFNYIFYQKLGILGDIESYHLFEIFMSAVAVLLVFLFACEAFGLVTGIFSSLFLASYPLFWSESHFNIKDPVETAFITGAVYWFWKGVKDNKPVFILLSSIFSGFALGVKFNILFFAPLFLWLIYKSFKKIGKRIIIPKKLIFSYVLFPVIMIGVFILFWPFLWHNTINNFLSIVVYYQDVGVGVIYQSNYVWGVLNLYPLYWIFITTPPIILLLFFFGAFSFYHNRKKQKDELILLLIWLVVAVGRVTHAGISIYGGDRQIMEFIPAMSIIAGVGVVWLGQRFKRLRFFNTLLCTSVFIFLLLPLWRLHPNENVYFNFIVGGLRGAVDKKVPAAGNSFGNAYKEGVDWLNANIPQNSKLAIIQGATANLPIYKIRPDIDYDNTNFSGIERKGEYLMEVFYNQEIGSYHYAWDYVTEFLIPVYEVKVDGVPILIIWKNDLANTRNLYQKNESPYQGRINVNIENNLITLDLSEKVSLSRMDVFWQRVVGCQDLKDGYVETSLNGNDWTRSGDPIPSDQVARTFNYSGNTLRYFFAGDNAKFIKLVTDSPDSCILNRPLVKITALY